jgi:hypothetical protein
VSPAEVLTCRAPGVALKWHDIADVLKREGGTKMLPRLAADQATSWGLGVGVSGSQPEYVVFFEVMILVTRPCAEASGRKERSSGSRIAMASSLVMRVHLGKMFPR